MTSSPNPPMPDSPTPPLLPVDETTATADTTPRLPAVVTPLPGENTPITPLAPEKGGFRGCMGCLGVIGALALLLLILALGAIGVSIQAAGNVGAGISNAFNGAGNFVSGLFGAAPTTRVITLPEIDRIKQLAQLATIRFNYANIVSSQTEMPALLAGLYGESLLMVAVGHVEAGIDFNALTAADIVYDATTETLRLQLPAPQLFNCFLNETQSYIVERSSGIFAASSPALDNTSRRYALQQFRDTALEDGILAQAQTEAQTVMQEFLAVFMTDTRPQIRITFATPAADPPLPETCQ